MIEVNSEGRVSIKHSVEGPECPGRAQTVAIYDAVAGGDGDAARWMVNVVSAVSLLPLTLANRLEDGTRTIGSRCRGWISQRMDMIVACRE